MGKEPFYYAVPKDLPDNLRYRIAVLERAAEDLEFRAAMMGASKRDILFWLNTFCWLHEPRPARDKSGNELPQIIPFITWPHQDVAIRETKAVLGYEDIGWEKSRGEGGSWIAVLFGLHDFLFYPMSAVGMVSKDERSVDDPSDSGSLFWKLDWELTKLPKWMVPPQNKIIRNKTNHSFVNMLNHATINGFSAVADVASGNRKKWFLMDELSKFPQGDDYEAMASTQHVSNSRLIIATPRRTAGAYYDIMHHDSSMLKLILDWQDNPTRNVGLYTMSNGVPVAVDPENNPLPANYDPPTDEVKKRFDRLRRNGFALDNRLRSPWYDHECDRANATPQKIARELDRSYSESMDQVYREPFFRAAERTVRAPTFRGDFIFHPETFAGEVCAVEHGPLSLWLPLDMRGRPPAGSYYIGADVAGGGAGSYSSNSALCIINGVTMEQVGEFVSNSIRPDKLADLSMALGRWLGDALLNWEANGPGMTFLMQVKESTYPNVYQRTVIWNRGAKKTQTIGWHTDPSNREIMHGELLRAVQEEELTLRSAALLKECGQYIRQRGKIVHVLGGTASSTNSKGEAHGDLVVAAAVCLQGIRKRPAVREGDVPLEIPPNCLAARMERDERERQMVEHGWDDRTNAELCESSRAWY